MSTWGVVGVVLFWFDCCRRCWCAVLAAACFCFSSLALTNHIYAHAFICTRVCALTERVTEWLFCWLSYRLNSLFLSFAIWASHRPATAAVALLACLLLLCQSKVFCCVWRVCPQPERIGSKKPMGAWVLGLDCWQLGAGRRRLKGKSDRVPFIVLFYILPGVTSRPGPLVRADCTGPPRITTARLNYRYTSQISRPRAF